MSTYRVKSIQQHRAEHNKKLRQYTYKEAWAVIHNDNDADGFVEFMVEKTYPHNVDAVFDEIKRMRNDDEFRCAVVKKIIKDKYKSDWGIIASIIACARAVDNTGSGTVSGHVNGDALWPEFGFFFD